MECSVEGTHNGIHCGRDTQWIPLSKVNIMESFVEEAHTMEASIEGKRNGAFCRRDVQRNLL